MIHVQCWELCLQKSWKIEFQFFLLEENSRQTNRKADGNTVFTKKYSTLHLILFAKNQDWKSNSLKDFCQITFCYCKLHCKLLLTQFAYKKRMQKQSCFFMLDLIFSSKALFLTFLDGMLTFCSFYASYLLFCCFEVWRHDKPKEKLLPH